MKTIRTFRSYWKCIKEILSSTFESKENRLRLYFSIIVLGLGICSNVAVPILLKKIVESFASQPDLIVTLILLSYGLIWMLSQASIHIRGILTAKIEQHIIFSLGIKVLSHLFDLSYHFFLEQKPGALTNVIRKSQQDIPNIILGVFFYVLPTILEFLFVSVLILNLYPLIYIIVMVSILVTFFLYTLFATKATLRYRETANEVDRTVDGIVIDWISNYEAIKVFDKKDLAVKVLKEELQKRKIIETSFLRKFRFSQLGQSIILGIGISMLTYLTGQGVLRNSLTVGDFILFNGYILQFILPISILGQVTQDIKKAFLDMKGIIDLLLTKCEVVEVTHPNVLTGSNFQVNFEGVSFKYNDRYILKNLSFEIQHNNTILIVGPTGAGKSTIAKLLLRLYDPLEGQIIINSINIKELSFKSLYDTIGWIPQESYFLNDTIKANMQFVCPEATQFDIENALERAHLYHFMKTLSCGINTVIGDRGLKLSGGEKQRLAIARLFLKKPKICIFDESTSCLDKNTDLIIQKNIKKFLPDTIKIIITHRPLDILKADKVITLNDSYN